jgi:hypothetical protein
MQKIVAYFKANWQIAAVIVGAALIVVSAMVIFFVFGARRNQTAVTPIGNANLAPVLPAGKTYTDLYAVSIDNHVDARPPSGLNQAAFVYEVPVEGGITRFLAVFERGVNVPEIGPVRSARPYFLDWVTELGPSLFLHFGGSPAAMSRIASIPYLYEADRDGTGSAGNGFWRDGKRDAPHNAYTSSANVEKMFASRGGSARTVTPWLMVPDPDSSTRGKADNFTVPMSTDAGYTPEWRYDPSRNLYARYIKNKAQLDRSGAPLEAKNIIVMKTDVQVLDSEGRLSVAIAGAGGATIYRNGETIAGIWNNDAGGALARFYRPDGSEVVLTEGNVWIEVEKK